jgi:hypothetical protein
MSRNDERYDPIGQVLPPMTPPITRAEAQRAVIKLYKHFGKAELRSANFGGPIQYKRTVARRCWASTKPAPGSDPNKGWPRLIHDVSHMIFRRRHPRFRPHDGGHATLEREIAQYVVAQGWLDSKPLRPKAAAKLSKGEARALRLARIEAAIQRWQAKQRRAENALRKLKRQQRAALRAAAAPC